jgi:hypothetical protein
MATEDTRTLRASQRGKGTVLGRVQHFLRFMNAIPRYRGKPWGEVVKVLTEGLTPAEVVTVLLATLHLQEEWGGQTPRQEAFYHLPALDDRRAWAAIELTLVTIDRLGEAERKQAMTVPGGMDLPA